MKFRSHENKCFHITLRTCLFVVVVFSWRLHPSESRWVNSTASYFLISTLIIMLSFLSNPLFFKIKSAWSRQRHLLKPSLNDCTCFFQWQMPVLEWYKFWLFRACQFLVVVCFFKKKSVLLWSEGICSTFFSWSYFFYCKGGENGLEVCKSCQSCLCFIGGDLWRTQYRTCGRRNLRGTRSSTGEFWVEKITKTVYVLFCFLMFMFMLLPLNCCKLAVFEEIACLFVNTIWCLF